MQKNDVAEKKLVLEQIHTKNSNWYNMEKLKPTLVIHDYVNEDILIALYPCRHLKRSIAYIYCDNFTLSVTLSTVVLHRSAVLLIV